MWALYREEVCTHAEKIEDEGDERICFPLQLFFLFAFFLGLNTQVDLAHKSIITASHLYRKITSEKREAEKSSSSSS